MILMSFILNPEEDISILLNAERFLIISSITQKDTTVLCDPLIFDI